MLGWSIYIHRGGTIDMSKDYAKIEGSEVLLSTGAMPNLSILDSLYAMGPSVQTKAQGGYPSIWHVPAGDLAELLEALDNRRTSPYDKVRNARETIQGHNIPGDELVYVEAWDQS
ncbi:MAG TPA: hypothetical protein VF281_02485 [Candidatus Saccharimonadales bacterium]